MTTINLPELPESLLRAVAETSGDYSYLAEIVTSYATQAVEQALASQWQPIDNTVPEDTVLLLYSPDRGPANKARIEARAYHDTKAGSRHAWATHWAPLPAPPAIASQGETK